MSLLFQVYTSVSSSEYISRRGPLGIDFFISYRSKVHLENEFQVDLRCRRTPSRAATAIVKRRGRREVTSEQEIYTPCQTATWEKSTGGAIINQLRRRRKKIVCSCLMVKKQVNCRRRRQKILRVLGEPCARIFLYLTYRAEGAISQTAADTIGRDFHLSD